MQYLTIGLGIATVVCGIVIAVMSAAMSDLRKELGELTTKLEDAKREASGDAQQAKIQLDAATASRDRVIAGLKTEIDTLEKDLDADKTPAAVRARLSQLFPVP